MGLQFVPIYRLRLLGKDDFMRLVGSGWPMSCFESGGIGWGELVFNIGFLIALLYWMYVLLERRIEHFKVTRTDFILTAVLCIFWFGVACVTEPMAIQTPWWESWRSTLFVFCSMLIIITSFRYIRKRENIFVEYLADRGPL